MIDQSLHYAVIGASTNKEKYGYIVYKDLLDAGYQVTPVNPKLDTLLEQKTYPDLQSIPTKPDVVIFVVPPTVTESLIPDAISLGIRIVWMQPGSESDKAIQLCEQAGIECIHNACVMIQRKS